MKPLFAEATVKLTTDDIVELNELIKRNEPMPVTEVDEKYSLARCGACGTFNGNTNNFCTKCGQPLDQENIAL